MPVLQRRTCPSLRAHAARAAVACGLLMPVVAAAQRPLPAPPRPPIGMSVMAGGMALAESKLAVGKLSVELGKWAFVGDVTRDAAREEWNQDGSSGDYLMWAFSASVRRYTRPLGRGFFIEGGAGTATMRLDVSEPDGTTTERVGDLPMASWGLGGRFGMGRSRAFAEVGYRSAIPLRTRHLHADAAPPPVDAAEPIAFRSWYLEKGRATGQLFLGVGLSF